jgi:glycerophosphoryl diester phosphodiesterase
MIEVIAHRGFSAQAPENTLAALRAALAGGADAVEWDVHVAACGTPVLFHDETLDRTTDGVGPLADRDFTELRGLDAGSWFDPAFAGEPIPSFAEALELIGPSEATVYPEVKGFRRPEDLDAMARTVLELGMLDRVVFISLDFDAVDRLSLAHPRVGYVVARASDVPAALSRASRLDRPGLLDLDYRLLLEEPDLVGRIRNTGSDVAVWTVDRVREADALAGIGVRRITTNRVASMVRWRAGWTAPSPGA